MDNFMNQLRGSAPYPEARRTGAHLPVQPLQIFQYLKPTIQTGFWKIFVAQEKDRVLSLLNDKTARERNRTLFKNRTERHVTGEANYKGYVFVFVRDTGQERPSPLTFIQTENGYKRTNALSGDETFDVVFSALHNGGRVLALQ